MMKVLFWKAEKNKKTKRLTTGPLLDHSHGLLCHTGRLFELTSAGVRLAVLATHGFGGVLRAVKETPALGEAFRAGNARGSVQALSIFARVCVVASDTCVVSSSRWWRRMNSKLQRHWYRKVLLARCRCRPGGSRVSGRTHTCSCRCVHQCHTASLSLPRGTRRCIGSLPCRQEQPRTWSRECTSFSHKRLRGVVVGEDTLKAE